MDPRTFPTKGNLMLAKNSLALARQGYDLMDKNGIIVWAEIPFVGPGGYNDKGFVDLPAFRANGKEQLKELIRQHVKYVPDAGQPTYAFSTTKESIDIAREAFRKVKDLTIKLSMVENAAYRLASNIKKTQKRANALQNITIPMYSNLVYSITNALEEKEREEFTRLKVIKRMKEKKASG